MRLSAPNRRPARRQTLAELRELQRKAGSMILRSLDADFQTQQKWIDGRDTQDVAAEFIKPNDRLTSFERIEIYNRQYWFRLIDSIYDDFPGLLAILGSPKFSLLARAYLAKYPSRSFTMRNLGSSMPKFLAEEPSWSHPYEEMALDMARFEWAQIVAFDGPAKPPIAAADLAGRDPTKLKLGLQPNLSLMDLAYPLDKFVLAVKKQGMRSEASNAMEEENRSAKTRRIPRPRRKQTFVAVYRLRNDLFFKSLDAAQYRLLNALTGGMTLAKACEQIAGQISPKKLSDSFATWTSLGWFCKPG